MFSRTNVFSWSTSTKRKRRRHARRYYPISLKRGRTRARLCENVAPNVWQRNGQQSWPWSTKHRKSNRRPYSVSLYHRVSLRFQLVTSLAFCYRLTVPSSASPRVIVSMPSTPSLLNVTGENDMRYCKAAPAFDHTNLHRFIRIVMLCK